MSKIEQALAKAAAERKRGYSSPQKPEEKKKSIRRAAAELTPEILLGMDPRLIAFFGRTTAAAEQYKQLRTKLLRAKKLYSHNAILITSALAGEGKTTTVASLAITISQGLQETVLLIDADLRKPALHKIMGIDPRHPGLADYLSGKVTIEETLVKTKLPKLTVIPAGTIPPNPSELVSSEKMVSLISEVKNRYHDRMVLFDSPPVVSLTDSIALGQKVDAAVLVIFAGRTPREAVLDAVHSLNEINLMGIVLNHFDALPLYYGKYRMKRYYSYGYGYGYGYGGKKPEE